MNQNLTDVTKQTLGNTVELGVKRSTQRPPVRMRNNTSRGYKVLGKSLSTQASNLHVSC